MNERPILHTARLRLAALSRADIMKIACAIAPILDKPNDAGSQYLDAGSSPQGLSPRCAWLIGFSIAAKPGNGQARPARARGAPR